MNPIQVDAVRPVEGFREPSKEYDIEKVAPTAHETTSDDDAKSVNSEKFQNGVQRVRAITEIWSKTTLIAMFVLYVPPPQIACFEGIANSTCLASF